MPTGEPTKMKPCKICGNMFLPKKPSQRFCEKDHYTTCPICGKSIIWNSTRTVEPCSSECRKEFRRLANIEKYGYEHPMQSPEVQKHHRESMMKKYGVAYPLQSDEIKQKVISTNLEKFGSEWALSNSDVKEKAKATMVERYGAETTLESEELSAKVAQTNLERYGVENVMQCDEIREKAEQTTLDKYGVENVMKNPEIAAKSSASRSLKIESIIEKSKATWMSNLGVDNPSKSQEVIDKITATFISRYGVKHAVNVPEFRDKMIASMTAKFGVPYYWQSEEHKSSNYFRISKINLKFSELLKSQSIEFEMEHHLQGKSYDFYIPSCDTFIEIDPSYTHNIIGNHCGPGLTTDYHLTKTKLANENGYRCIHVFDWDDWDSIISLIQPKKTIYARKTQVLKLYRNVADEFLRANHIQGTCRGQLLCLGLVMDGELYQVMTFGKSRYDKSHSIELLRLCTRKGFTVVGGASKLFQTAIKTFEVSNVISYCDVAKFSGDVYEKLGMSLIRTTSPQEVWSRGDRKITATLLRQRGYDQLFGTSFGKGTSNEELMLNDGWLPIYDCGQKVFEYK